MASTHFNIYSTGNFIFLILKTPKSLDQQLITCQVDLRMNFQKKRASLDQENLNWMYPRDCSNFDHFQRTDLTAQIRKAASEMLREYTC